MKEGQIQAGFRAYLDKMGLAYIIPIFGRRSTIKASWPDVTIVHCNRALLVEIKTEKGLLKPGQKELFAKLARDNGTVVQVCRSVEDCIRVTQQWLGTLEAPSAVSTLPAQNDASTGILEGKEGDASRLAWVHEGAAKEYIDRIGSPVNGTASPGQAFLDNIPHASERIGEWQGGGGKWLIRMDKRGQEYFVRKATQDDLTRLAGKA